MAGASVVSSVYFISSLDLVAVSMIMPLLASHLRSLGASHLLIGIFSSSYGGLQLLTGPLVGTWSDLKGRRTILLISVTVCSFCYIATGIIVYPYLLLFLRLIIGMTKHTQTLCKALIGDLVTSDHQTEANGKLMAYSGVGFMVGPIIAGHLMELEGGFFLVHFVAGVMFWCILGVTYFLLPADAKVLKYNHKNNVGLLSVFEELANVNWSSYWDILILKFLLGVSMACFYNGYSLYIQDSFNTSPKWIGYTISFQGFIGAVSGFSSEHIEKVYSGKSRIRNIFSYMIIFLLSLVFMSLAQNFLTFIILLVPFSFTASLLRISMNAALIEKTSPDKLGSLVGSANSMSSIARMVAPLTVGIVQDILGNSGVFLACITTALLGSIIIAYIWLCEKKI